MSNSGQFQKGQSGNPEGRPPGLVDRRRRMASAYSGEFDAIAEAVIKKAKEGDVAAASLYLSRVDPPLKPKAEKVRFTLNTALPLAQQAAQVVQAVANAEIAPEDAQIVLSCLSTYAQLVQADEVQARLAALERATNTARSAAPGGVYVVENMQ